MKKLRVTVDGKIFDVTVEVLDDPAGTTAPRAVLPAAAPQGAAPAATYAPPPAASTTAPAPAAPVAGAGAVASPLAGRVVSIDVKVGQAVEEGAQLATLEAMKMNTYVYAPKAGTVSAVHVNAGDAVEEGAALLSLG